MTVLFSNVRRIFLAFCFAIFFAPAYAATLPSSLFFNAEEEKMIGAEARKMKNPSSQKAGMVHLGAIMYGGPHDWSVWLQGEKWTPSTKHKSLRILNVAPDRVRLRVTSFSDDKTEDITLRPNQTWNPVTGKIEEGME